jgi:hypothetical protein
MRSAKLFALPIAILIGLSPLFARAAYATPLPSDPCALLKRSADSKDSNASITGLLRTAFPDDPTKVEALSYAIQRHCIPNLTNLSATPQYNKLFELLRKAMLETEASGQPASDTIVSLEAIGVRRREEKTSRNLPNGEWQLVIEPKAKAEMSPKSAGSLASTGLLLIEAMHQVRSKPELSGIYNSFLTTVEQAATEIIAHADENLDGRFGWGQIWFKGKDGLLLHSSNPAQNMHFGGYTYFPRADKNGRQVCEASAPLKEEAFDHAHNTLFLLETYLVSHNRDLAKKILLTVGKSFDDTFDEGAPDRTIGSAGWNYWKQLGKSRNSGLIECEANHEIKNTNLRMGVAMLLYAEILRHNQVKSASNPDPSRLSDKYLRRAQQVIATNNNEIFVENNYGYQGIANRALELGEPGNRGRAVYDRTQVKTSLTEKRLTQLQDIIRSGDEGQGIPMSTVVTLCGGDSSSDRSDRGIAGSCWNHLPFEAEDYFRLMRFSDAWTSGSTDLPVKYLDAMGRNLAASKVLHDGRANSYSHYYPNTREGAVSNDVVNAAFYGFFCMAKNVKNQTTLKRLPVPHRRLFEDIGTLCADAPIEDAAQTGVTWKRGYKFYEIYLTADRFAIPSDDWLFENKK